MRLRICHPVHMLSLLSAFSDPSPLLYLLLCSVESADQIGREGTIPACSCLRSHLADRAPQLVF